MSEKSSPYNIEMDGKVFATIVVPFSEDEIGKLRKVWEIKNSWVGEVVRTSGLHRDLYIGLAIPWGYGLQDRDKAAHIAAGSVEEINTLLARPDKSEELKTMEEGLKTIATSLLSVFSADSEQK